MSSIPVNRNITRQALAEQKLGDGQSCNTAQKKNYAAFMDKMNRLRFALEADLLACEAKWMLFVAASLGYRYDLNLKPLPPSYNSEQQGPDIDSLVSVINETPKLRVVLAAIVTEEFHEIDIEVFELLHYVLVVLYEPRLRMVDEDEFSTIITKMIPDTADFPPTHVFEVCKPLTTSSSGGFPLVGADTTTKLAFHGNKLDRFFSIINCGFRINPEEQNHILLTTSFTDALNSSPNGAGWGGSSCGSMITCVALCEYKENDQLVKVVKSDVIVRDGSLVRPRYLIFYGSRFPDEEEAPKRESWWDWIKRHKYALSLGCYLIIIASVGYANSGYFFRNKLGGVVNFYRRIFNTD